MTLGIALLDFDLGNYKEAQPLLAKLLADRKLGQPQIPHDENGQETLSDNDRYWEATLKLLQSNVQLAKAEGNAGVRDETTAALKRLYIQWGDQTGGTRYHQAFDQLRQELAPDFNPAALQ